MNLLRIKNFIGLLLCLIALTPIVNAADYHWVEGTGDWSDLAHWATTSGGATKHTALPTSTDNVFFDGASFGDKSDVVTIQTDVFFRDLRITSGLEVTFTGPKSVTMNCYGLILIFDNVQYNFKGTLRLVGSGPPQTISAINNSLGTHVIFDNPDGQWIAGPFRVDSLLQFVSGNLIVVDDIETKYVDMRADVPSRLRMQQEIVLTGSDFIHNGMMIPVAFFDLTNIDYALASKGFLQFFGSESTCRIIPAGQTFSLDGVSFFNTEGIAHIDVVGFGAFLSRTTLVVPDGTFAGNFDTDILELGSGEVYTWEAAETFDIGSISAMGNSCVELTTFRSSIDGQEAFLRLQGSLMLNGGELIGVKDLHVLNGMISLLNSFDQGNISGWNIEEKELFEEEQIPICPGQDIYLKPFDPEEEWAYNWNDGSTLDSLNIFGIGTYSLEVTDLEGCKNSDTIEVFLFDPGSFSIGNDTTICDGEAIDVMVDVVADSYQWSNGDATAMTVLPIGEHSVEVLLNGCTVIDTILISAKPIPIVDLGGNQMKCVNESFNLSLSLSGVEYEWSDGSTISNFSTSDQGTYWVDVSLNGCTARDSIDLEFIELPTVSLGRDSILCEGDVLVYDFDNLGLSFEWNDNNTASNRSITTPGEYWIEATDGQCTQRDSVVIGVAPRASFNLGRDTMLCTGESITLSANPTSDETIMWIDGSNELTFDVGQSGAYWLDVNKRGCVVRDEIIVTFNDPPAFNLGTDTLICEQVPLVLRPGIANATYRWQDGSAGNQFSVDRPGIYSVEVTENGCTTIDEVNIDTRICTFYQIYLPEVFSPNADGINDIYKPEFSPDIQIFSFEMAIYDRWGSQLFKSEDPVIGWDGTFSQKTLNTGTFVYTIAIDYMDDRGVGTKLHRGEFVILK